MPRSINLFFLAWCLYIPLATAQQGPVGLRLSGTVLDSDTRRPIAGVSVKATGDQGAAPATTDTDGLFLLQLAPNTKLGETVRIRFEKSGYEPYDKSCVASSEIPINVSMRRVTTNKGKKEAGSPPSTEVKKPDNGNQPTENHGTSDSVTAYVTHGPDPGLPDATLELVHPREFAVYVYNDGKVVANKVRYWFTLWDLDQLTPDGIPKVVQIPQQSFEYLRHDSPAGPYAVMGEESVKRQVKDGDRLFGAMAATCPDCKFVRGYYVYVVVGTSGWFSEIPQTKTRTTEDWFALVKQVHQNPSIIEKLLINSKVPIR
jgi:hypothetical protein